jgi:hypothetical protein
MCFLSSYHHPHVARRTMTPDDHVVCLQLGDGESEWSGDQFFGRIRGPKNMLDSTAGVRDLLCHDLSPAIGYREIHWSPHEVSRLYAAMIMVSIRFHSSTVYTSVNRWTGLPVSESFMPTTSPGVPLALA